jgi:hypothetical protein
MMGFLPVPTYFLHIRACVYRAERSLGGKAKCRRWRRSDLFRASERNGKPSGLQRTSTRSSRFREARAYTETDQIGGDGWISLTFAPASTSPARGLDPVRVPGFPACCISCRRSASAYFSASTAGGDRKNHRTGTASSQLTPGNAGSQLAG